MPKIRGFKPETWTDYKFASLSPLARLLYMGMWNYACDNGHLDDEPGELKMRILPLDDCDPEDLVAEIASKGRIKRANGLITIPKLAEHQKVDKRWMTTCEHCPEEVQQAAIDARPKGRTTGAQRAQAGRPTDARPDVELSRVDSDSELIGAPKGARAQKRAIPDDWHPHERHQEFAAENSVDIDFEAAQFADHHRGKGSTMKDWDAAFWTWLRNTVKWRKPEPVNGVERTPRTLPPHATELTHPPDGLTGPELAEWYINDAKARKAAR